MPAMYPEELAKLRADHPNLQYDFRGNVMGVSPAYTASSIANDIRGIMNGYQQPNAWDFGPTRADYQNSSEFIGPLQPQWWDPNGELAQRGLGALVSGQDLPDVGFYSQWNPDTNSWVRHGAPSGGYRQPSYGAAPRRRQPAEPFMGAPYPFGTHDDGSGENARPFMGAPYPFDHDDGSGEFTPGGY